MKQKSDISVKEVEMFLLEMKEQSFDINTPLNNVFIFFFLFIFFLFFLFSFSQFFLQNHFSLKKKGETALFFAAENGHKQIVQFLLEKENPNLDFQDQVFFLLIF